MFAGWYRGCQAKPALRRAPGLLHFCQESAAQGSGGAQQGTMMIKSFGMLHKRGDISQEQFHAHWRGPHAEHAVKLVPIMRRYVQNHRAPAPYPGYAPPADGCPEVWLDSLETAKILTTMPEYMTGAFIDEPAFMRVRSDGVLVRETVVNEGPKLGRQDRPVKALFFLKRGAAVSQRAFEDFWLNRDTPLLAGGAHVQRWVKSTLVPQAYAGADALYDGVEELWWPDQAAHDRDAAAAALSLQLDKHVDRGATRVMFVDENRVVWDD